MTEEKQSIPRQIGCGFMALTLGLTGACMLGVNASPAYAEQTGSGETSLVIHLSDNAERGGTSAVAPYENPDTTGNGLGDNLAFTVPTRIDFVASADGTLIGPDASVAYVENESRYGVRISSLQVNALNDWNIVDDAMESEEGNDVDLTVGPESDLLNAADYLEKKGVSQPSSWNMAARSTTGTDDRVELSLSGHINNVANDITSESAFGQINWYVTPGNAQ